VPNYEVRPPVSFGQYGNLARFHTDYNRTVPESSYRLIKQVDVRRGGFSLLDDTSCARVTGDKLHRGCDNTLIFECVEVL
jgi:hypothetical protein